QLQSRVVEITWRAYSFERYARVLDSLLASGQSIYSSAYIMPSPPFGDRRKHRNHLRLIERMMTEPIAAGRFRRRTTAGIHLHGASGSNVSSNVSSTSE